MGSIAGQASRCLGRRLGHWRTSGCAATDTVLERDGRLFICSIAVFRYFGSSWELFVYTLLLDVFESHKQCNSRLVFFRDCKSITLLVFMARPFLERNIRLCEK